MQQVNLFQFVALPHKSRLDTQFALQLSGGFLGLLLCLYLLSYFQTSHEISKLNLQSAQLDKARQELMVLAAKYPQTVSSDIIDASKLPVCNIKFSNYLRAFAEALLPGIWLTDIGIADSGKTVVLKGHALQVPLAEAYLERLKENKIFQNFNITLDDLNKSQPVLNFQLTAKEN
jgi:hypothetical protein